MAVTKNDAHEARVRDAMILPFKRKMASLTIRSDLWKDHLGPKSKPNDGQLRTRSLARSAIAEVDEQVILLGDLKLPGEKKARDSEAEVQGLMTSFAAMRLMLVGLVAEAAVPSNA